MTGIDLEVLDHEQEFWTAIDISQNSDIVRVRERNKFSPYRSMRVIRVRAYMRSVFLLIDTALIF